MDLSLFIVLLGGRSLKSNIEVHDVRWVLGESIEDTFPELRRQWFGQSKGLHIDSYKCIKYIEGYKIVILDANKNKTKRIDSEEKSLWFVNLGGYNKKSMNEQHEFTLVVAKKATEAKRKAKKNWKLNLEQKHNDDCSEIINIEKIDDIHSIRKINEWDIKLIYDSEERDEKIIPDWYGYLRIDKF